jgi:hypothetical protein
LAGEAFVDLDVAGAGGGVVDVSDLAGVHQKQAAYCSALLGGVGEGHLVAWLREADLVG